MSERIISVVAIIVAVLLGIMAVVLPAGNLATVIIISRFFEVMIPILAVGALLKYLLSWCCHHHHHD